jgi:dynein heavy chain 1
VDQLREAEEKWKISKNATQEPAFAEGSQGSPQVQASEVEGSLKIFEQFLNEGLKWKNGNTAGLIEEMSKARKSMNERITQSVSKWSSRESFAGIANPVLACKYLNDILSSADDLLKQLGGMNLSLGTLSLPPLDINPVERLKKDVEDERSRWLQLNVAYERLLNTRNVRLRDCDTRQILQQLNDILTTVKGLPQAVHSFPAYMTFIEHVRQHIDGCILLDELKGDTMKVRHWEELGAKLNVDFFSEFEAVDSEMQFSSSGDVSAKQLAQQDGLKTPVSGHLVSTAGSPITVVLSHTIGFIMDMCIWNKNVSGAISITKDILLTAQGEYAIDTFLTQLKDKYQRLDFQTLEYGDKCLIIRNWDFLFQHLSEDLSQLEGMRWSPYYSTFVSDAATWTERLTRLQSTLDRWALVQTKWVELEGVFAVVRGAEFSAQAPIMTYAEEFRKSEKEFLSISNQYLRKSPAYVSSLEANPQLPQVLERLIKTLENVQHGLSQYLEQQRNLFARFFFLGDEDMVDMIGAAQDVSKTQRHLRKLFAGIHYLLVDSEVQVRN